MAGNGQQGENLTRRGAGRPRGSRNKSTLAIKQALSDSFEELGGKDWLLELARSEPKTYAQLIGKVIPAELHAKHSGDVSLTVVSGIDSPPGSEPDGG